MPNEGAKILCALYARLKPPPSEDEAERLAEYFCGEEEKDADDVQLQEAKKFAEI